MNTTIEKKSELEELNGIVNKKNNLDSNSKKGKIVNLKEIEKTPFSIYGEEEEKCVVLLGNYRLTEEMNKKECKEWIKEITWNKIIQVIMVVQNININIKEVNNAN